MRLFRAAAAVLFLLGTSVESAAQCTRDEDCNLNGVCSKTIKKCSCAPEWRGPTCGQLNLLPAKRDGGYNEDDSSSWGGSIVEHNGTFHMFAARMVGHCGLSTWQQNSEMVRAVSKDPEGPYRWAETLQGVFSHGPKACGTPRRSCTLM